MKINSYLRRNQFLFLPYSGKVNKLVKPFLPSNKVLNYKQYSIFQNVLLKITLEYPHIFCRRYRIGFDSLTSLLYTSFPITLDKF